jgi:hypothetical protein
VEYVGNRKLKKQDFKLAGVHFGSLTGSVIHKVLVLCKGIIISSYKREIP